MFCTVSLPVKVEVSISDLETGCGYLYRGVSVADCVSYFQSLFFKRHKYEITNVRSFDK